MKKCLAFLLSAAVSAGALATTLSPIQLLNPTGSVSGQTILSTGASTAPAWGNVSAATLTGIVPVANGGTNASTASGTALDNITGFASTGFLTRTGAGTYAFQSATNGITFGNLAQTGANTLLGNATGSTANVASVAVTGCNGAGQALQWTNGSGFSCNSAIATSGANANITSLSGLSTPLSVSQGGTGLATITSHGVLVGTGTSAIVPLAVGTTGQILVGVTGANPAFGNTVSTLIATGSITPSSTAGIVGTTTNDSPAAGSVGELIENSTATTSATSGAALNASSVSLTAGEWDVSGICATNPAATTTTSIVICGISTTSATFQSVPGAGGFFYAQAETASFPANSQEFIAAPVRQIKLASTTTIYLVGQANFATSTLTISGYIRARRVR